MATSPFIMMIIMTITCLRPQNQIIMNIIMAHTDHYEICRLKTKNSTTSFTRKTAANGQQNRRKRTQTTANPDFWLFRFFVYRSKPKEHGLRT